MKTLKKWLAISLCLALMLGLSVTAFAATTTAPEDIAKEFMAMLKEDGIKYNDRGIDSDGDYRIDITYPGENLEEHNVVLFVNKNGQGFAAFEWYLMDYEDARMLEVLKTLNNLNLNYRYVTFIADTTDNTITAKTSGALQGDAKQAAAVLHYGYDWLPIVLDAVWPTLEAGVKGSGVDPEDANFVDTWYFSSITFTRDAGDITAGTVMTAKEVGADLYVATFNKNGKVSFVSTIKDSDFTASWEQDGITATLTDDTGTFLVTMTDEDTIVLDAAEVGGYIMTLVREGSEAYKALTA